MSARIDHAAKAVEWLTPAEGVGLSWEETAALAALAQVHATLALVEQQRIANLITVAGWVVDSSTEDVGYDLDKLRTGIAGEVWEALGLGVAVSEIFEWDGRGSAMILTEHEHVHQDGRCVKNRYDVACSTPRGRWTGEGVS